MNEGREKTLTVPIASVFNFSNFAHLPSSLPKDRLYYSLLDSIRRAKRKVAASLASAEEISIDAAELLSEAGM